MNISTKFGAVNDFLKHTLKVPEMVQQYVNFLKTRQKDTDAAASAGFISHPFPFDGP